MIIRASYHSGAANKPLLRKQCNMENTILSFQIICTSGMHDVLQSNTDCRTITKNVWLLYSSRIKL